MCCYSVVCISQELTETHIGDSSNIQMLIYAQNDTTYSIINIGRNRHWKVYLTSRFEKLIVNALSRNDSVVFLRYYRSGKIKKKIIEHWEKGVLYTCKWCENGQIIHEAYWNEAHTAMTYFYCNGNKLLDFTLEFGEFVGVRIW